VALEKYEFFELEYRTKPASYDYAMDFIDESVERIRKKHGKPSPEISPKTENEPVVHQHYDKGSISTLREGNKDSDLCNVRVKKVGKVTSGTARSTGNQWTRQDMTVTDDRDDLLVVAWDDEKLSKVREGDIVDINNFAEVVMYKGTMQLKLGSKSKVVIE
jgi:hypothetical protein